jgi:hypothetical protein
MQIAELFNLLDPVVGDALLRGLREGDQPRGRLVVDE